MALYRFLYCFYYKYRSTRMLMRLLQTQIGASQTGVSQTPVQAIGEV